MRTEKTAIYKATVSTPLGEFIFAVLSTEQDVKTDLLSAVAADLTCSFGLLRIKEIKKSNRSVVKSMWPLKLSVTWKNGEPHPWAWVQK